MKTCRECGNHLDIENFYAHARMADGYLNKCKACVTAKVKLRRRSNPAVQAYDRERWNLPHRKKAGMANSKQWRKNNPEKYKAHNAVNNAIRDGRLQKVPCRCGSKRVHGHHTDYTKPLEVIWLCAQCHQREHHP